MRVGWVYSDRFLEHDTGPGHPERPDRLRAVVRGLREAGILERLVPIEGAPIDRSLLERLHTPAYIDRVERACASGERTIDCPDSAICRESYEVALLAAGSVVKAADAIAAGVVDRAFCAVRPPGHHAERDRSMGFCLFDNVALAAERMVTAHGLERVAIVDFDVHHGNGTQHLFEDRADVLFVSLHQDPRTLYPGTGFARETGRGKGEGYTLNLPLAPGGGDAMYRAAFDNSVLPRLADFRPQAVLISAGFDAAAADPLANMQVTPDGFAWMTERLVEVAAQHAEGRVLSVLEGGYDLASLAACSAAHVEALLSDA